MDLIRINGIGILVEEAECYIQINDISEDDLTKVWPAIKGQYTGFELCLCFRDVPIPTNALAEIGAEVLEDCVKTEVTLPGYKPHNALGTMPLEKSGFAEFAALHDATHPAPDMYWTSQRIINKWDIWRIFVLLEDGMITGYTMMMTPLRDDCTHGEIFALEAKSSAQRKALLSAAVNCAFVMGRSEVINMVERHNTREYEESSAVGFREAGYYVGYRVGKI